MGDDPAGWRLERRAATTHGEIAWDVFGHGPPVVLVHGTPSRSMLWRNVVPVLAERFTIASLVSGAPSTLHSILRDEDPLESRAIGSIVVRSDDHGRLLLVAIPIHIAVSIGWAIIFSYLLPVRRRVLSGMAFGSGVAYINLRLVGRAFPRIYALPLAPQIADHIAFGAVVAA